MAIEETMIALSTMRNSRLNSGIMKRRRAANLVSMLRINSIDIHRISTNRSTYAKFVALRFIIPAPELGNTLCASDLETRYHITLCLTQSHVPQCCTTTCSRNNRRYKPMYFAAIVVRGNTSFVQKSNLFVRSDTNC